MRAFFIGKVCTISYPKIRSGQIFPVANSPANKVALGHITGHGFSLIHSRVTRTQLEDSKVGNYEFSFFYSGPSFAGLQVFRHL